jgi:hypothetical protein
MLPIYERKFTSFDCFSKTASGAKNKGIMKFLNREIYAIESQSASISPLEKLPAGKQLH